MGQGGQQEAITVIPVTDGVCVWTLQWFHYGCVREVGNHQGW